MISFAFCTYNRSDRLEALVAAMRAQQCAEPFEILAVNNNSSDDTLAVLERLAAQPGAPLRYVTETNQGIVPARNRAIMESLDRDILIFIDDDELPEPGLLTAVCDAVIREGARCVGGAIRVDFTPHQRPSWLGKELLGFLAEVDHGDQPLWLVDDERLLWTGNIAYDISLFRENPALRFDYRYNRVGADVGGGEDAAMFRTLISLGVPIRYRPDMVTRVFVERWRLHRRYFLRLHFRAGLRYGQYSIADTEVGPVGIPLFMIRQFLRHAMKWMLMLIVCHPQSVRQGMNASHALGSLLGYRRRKREAIVDVKP